MRAGTQSTALAFLGAAARALIRHSLKECRFSRPLGWGWAMNHGPKRRPLTSFDHPGSARQVPPFGHRVPKPSTLPFEHPFVGRRLHGLLTTPALAPHCTGSQLRQSAGTMRGPPRSSKPTPLRARPSSTGRRSATPHPASACRRRRTVRRGASGKVSRRRDRCARVAVVAGGRIEGLFAHGDGEDLVRRVPVLRWKRPEGAFRRR